MLRSAGYSDLRFFWAAPEMRYTEQMVPIDAHSIRAARRSGTLVQGDTRTTRLVMPWIPSPLVRFVTRGLTVLAIKRDKN